MTLSELERKCKSLDLKYAFGKFPHPVSPPHLVGSIIDTDNFGADNKVWHSTINFRLELTTLNKDTKLQKQIEKDLLNNIYWQKKENVITSEDVYNTSYFFEIKEEENYE